MLFILVISNYSLNLNIIASYRRFYFVMTWNLEIFSHKNMEYSNVFFWKPIWLEVEVGQISHAKVLKEYCLDSYYYMYQAYITLKIRVDIQYYMRKWMIHINASVGTKYHDHTHLNQMVDQDYYPITNHTHNRLLSIFIICIWGFIHILSEMQ